MIRTLPSGRALLTNPPYELGVDYDEIVKTADTVGKVSGNKKVSKAADAGKAALGGAAAGAAAGSVIPGIGTAIGAVGGAIAGLASSLISGAPSSASKHRKERRNRANITIANDKVRLAKFKPDLNDTWFEGNLVYNMADIPGSQDESDHHFHRYINGKDTEITKSDAVKFIGITGNNWNDHDNKLLIASNLYSSAFLKNLKKPAPSAKALTKKVDKKIKKKIKATTNVSTVEALSNLAKTLRIKDIKREANSEHKAIVKEDKRWKNIVKASDKLDGKLDILTDLVQGKIKKANNLAAALGLPESYL